MRVRASVMCDACGVSVMRVACGVSVSVWRVACLCCVPVSMSVLVDMQAIPSRVCMWVQVRLPSPAVCGRRDGGGRPESCVASTDREPSGCWTQLHAVPVRSGEASRESWMVFGLLGDVSRVCDVIACVAAVDQGLWGARL